MARKKEETVEAIAPDPVLDSMKKLSSWFEKHAKVLGIGFVSVLLLILAVQYFQAQSERDASAITTELTEAIKSYEEATEPSKVLTSTVPGALDADLQKSHEKLAAVTKAHAGTGAGQLAVLYQADVARRLRKHDEAAELYKSYINAAQKDDALLFIAIEGAGYALEEQGKLDDALTFFTRLETDPSTAFYRDYGLKHKARVLEKKGDKAGAITAYQAIVAMEPPSELKSFAEERLKTLQ